MLELNGIRSVKNRMGAMHILPDTEPSGNYVYQYSVDGTVRYVGRGVGARYRRHLQDRSRKTRWSTFLRSKIRSGAEVVVQIVEDDMTPEAANQLEIKLIEKMGRKMTGTGPLLNMTAGGEFVDSETARILAAERNANPEHIEKQRQNAIRQHRDPAHKENMRGKAVERWSDPDWRAMNVEKLRAANGSKSARAKKSAATKELWKNQSHRESVIAKLKATHQERRDEINEAILSQNQLRKMAAAHFGKNYKYTTKTDIKNYRMEIGV